MAGPAVLLAGHATETWSILIEMCNTCECASKGAHELLPVSRSKGQDVSPGLPEQVGQQKGDLLIEAARLFVALHGRLCVPPAAALNNRQRAIAEGKIRRRAAMPKAMRRAQKARQSESLNRVLKLPLQ
eukprot:10501250-Heterocapsa_arctica.AAC.1